MNTVYETARADYRIIVDLVAQNASVLDLGCGDGELLYLLRKEKNIRGQGIEIDEQAIYACVAKGLNVLHGDIDTGLSEYRDGAFDYVILNESLQQVLHLEKALEDALRVGRNVIVGFPNFAYYRSRVQIVLFGRTPVTPSLPYTWYATPNLHFLSIRDFVEYCRKRNIVIQQQFYLENKRRVRVLPNLLANTGIFVIKKTAV